MLIVSIGNSRSCKLIIDVSQWSDILIVVSSIGKSLRMQHCASP